MIYRDRNWSFQQPPALEDGDTIERCNLSQLLPATILSSLAAKAITLRDTNLVNVSIDAGWTLERCNDAQIDFCAHLHPEMALAIEPENCRHVVSTDTVEIDGEQIVFRTHEDRVL